MWVFIFHTKNKEVQLENINWVSGCLQVVQVFGGRVAPGKFSGSTPSPDPNTSGDRGKRTESGQTSAYIPCAGAPSNT